VTEGRVCARGGVLYLPKRTKGGGPGTVCGQTVWVSALHRLGQGGWESPEARGVGKGGEVTHGGGLFEMLSLRADDVKVGKRTCGRCRQAETRRFAPARTLFSRQPRFCVRSSATQKIGTWLGAAVPQWHCGTVCRQQQ
jgi:hypothetical protein